MKIFYKQSINLTITKVLVKKVLLSKNPKKIAINNREKIMKIK